MKLLKYSEWESASGYWECNDVDDLGNGSGYWWHPARMMNISPAEYLKWVIDNFHPDRIDHSDDCSFVGFAWKSQSQMRLFKNKINALARQYNYQVQCNRSLM